MKGCVEGLEMAGLDEAVNVGNERRGIRESSRKF